MARIAALDSSGAKSGDNEVLMYRGVVRRNSRLVAALLRVRRANVKSIAPGRDMMLFYFPANRIT